MSSFRTEEDDHHSDIEYEDQNQTKMLRCSCLLLFSLFCCLCWRPSLFCYIRNCPLGGKRSVPSIIADADSSDGGKMIRKVSSRKYSPLKT